jgi:hypothetical protein
MKIFQRKSALVVNPELLRCARPRGEDVLSFRFLRRKGDSWVEWEPALSEVVPAGRPLSLKAPARGRNSTLGLAFSFKYPAGIRGIW